MPQGVDLPATNTCEILDLGEASPSWAPAPPMAEPRAMPDSVLLPEGTVLVANGSFTGFADTGANPGYLTELFDPETETWSPMCPPCESPGSTTPSPCCFPTLRYSPPAPTGSSTLIRSTPRTSGWRSSARPTSSSACGPRIVTMARRHAYGQPILVQTPDADVVSSACLIRNGAVTHSFNHDQRLVRLVIPAGSPSMLTVEASLAPPGWYMLFLLLNEGVPSIGSFVRARP